TKRVPPVSRRRFNAPTITPSPDESTNDTSRKSRVRSAGCDASKVASSERSIGDVATSISPWTRTTGFVAGPSRSSVSGVRITSPASGSRVIDHLPPGCDGSPRSRIRDRAGVRAERLETTHEQARHVHLADAHVLCNLRLRKTFEESQIHDL